MNCRECNESISDSAKFCNECGCAVHTEKSEAHTSDNEQVKPEKEAIDSHESDFSLPQKSSKAKKKKALIIAVSLVLVVALVVSGVIFIPQYIEKKRQEEIFEVYAILNDMNEEYAAGNYEKAKELARKLPDSNKVESYIGVIEFREKLDGENSSESLLENFADFCAEAQNYSFYRENSQDVGCGIESFDFSKINTQLIPGLRKEYEVALELDLVVKNFCSDFIYGFANPNSTDMDMLFYSTLKELNSLNTEEGIYTVEEAISNVERIADRIEKDKDSYSADDRLSIIINISGIRSIVHSHSIYLGVSRYGFTTDHNYSEGYRELSMTTYAVVCFITDMFDDVEIEIVNDSGSRAFDEIFDDVYEEYFPET